MSGFDLRPRVVRSALGEWADDLDDQAALDRYAAAAWSVIAEPGDGVAGAIVGALGRVEALRLVTHDGLLSGVGDPQTLARAQERWRPRIDAGAVSAALRTARANGVHLLVPGDPLWPSAVDDLGVHSPLTLWVRGDPARLGSDRPAVAIVGARAATAYGEHVAIDLGAGLVARGVAVVSGGAYGIDGAAHRAVLRAGGVTMALLAGGADRAYPAGHAGMLGDIAATGVVISEVPCGTAPTRWRFLQRNRLIAALSAATVVVEAGWRSGSLNTAGHASALGRPLGAVPGPVTSAASAGCHRLLREYDAVCVTGVDDVADLIGALPADSPSERASPGESSVDSDSRRVRDALSSRTPRSVTAIARHTGLAEADVAGRLGMLELEGRARRVLDGWLRGG